MEETDDNADDELPNNEEAFEPLLDEPATLDVTDFTNDSNLSALNTMFNVFRLYATSAVIFRRE